MLFIIPKSKVSFSRCDIRLELKVETETSCKKWGRTNDFTTVILPFSVRLLENQGFKILLIFSILSVTLSLVISTWFKENHAPRVLNCLLIHFIPSDTSFLREPSLCPPPWGVDILFLLFSPSDVRRHAWFPLI